MVDHSFLIYSVGPIWKFTTKSGWGGALNVGYMFENLEEDFEILDPVLVPAGMDFEAVLERPPRPVEIPRNRIS